MNIGTFIASMVSRIKKFVDARKRYAYAEWNGLYYPIVDIIGKPHIVVQLAALSAAPKLPRDGWLFDFGEERPAFEFVEQSVADSAEPSVLADSNLAKFTIPH